MPVNIYETAIQPIVDLDADVVVYVPGYALKGPGEPTLVNSTNFTTLFGDTPYLFKSNQSEDISGSAKNQTYRGRPEKGWLYAKGLVEAGHTVLFHRCNPLGVGTAATSENAIKLGILKNGSGGVAEDYKIKFGDSEYNVFLAAEAKYFGSYYTDLTIETSFPTSRTGNFTIAVKRGTATLESAVVSFNPSKNNFIGNQTFAYINLYPVVDGQSYKDDGFNSILLDGWYSDATVSGNPNYEKAIYPTATTVGLSLSLPLDGETGKPIGEEFTLASFMAMLSTGSNLEPLEDDDLYPSITYITSGGYYQSNEIAGLMQKMAFKIKSIALVDLPSTGELTPETLTTFRNNLLATGAATADMAKSTMYYGADTYSVAGYRIILPESFGYLQKLGSNINQAIPAWIPVANNPQGVVSAVATTRSIPFSLREQMVTNEGVSINPIIYRQNVGYVIMGNRTLIPVDGTPGPDAFLNCQLVVNTVARAARRAAKQLLIVSTNQQTAFSTFRATVSKTCDKMLVNGDGLASYSIIKKKKTKPATMDVVIELVVREGIETFNIYLPYSLELDN